MTKLRDEILTATENPSQLPTLATLENLPYLNATITETLRHTYGVVSRLPRIHVDETVRLKSQVLSSSEKGGGEEVDYVVPPNYPISMTSVHIHMNPTLFPNPQAFEPERWLDGQGRRRRDLDKYILSFSKGSRQCLGIKCVIFYSSIPYLSWSDTECCIELTIYSVVWPTRNCSPVLLLLFCVWVIEWNFLRQRGRTLFCTKTFLP
jgi:hypothetical protein